MADFSPRFLACLPFVLKEEGGYSNTPGCRRVEDHRLARIRSTILT
jgi:hypothetical protein